MTSLAAPPGGSAPPRARPDGAALRELGAGALLFWYDQARSDVMASHGSSDADHRRLLELHAEILRRLEIAEMVK